MLQPGDLVRALDDWDLVTPPIHHGDLLLVLTSDPCIGRLVVLQGGEMITIMATSNDLEPVKVSDR